MSGHKEKTAHRENRRGNFGISLVVVGALVSGFIGGSLMPALKGVFAFSGPPSSPGIGGGAILVDGGNNLSIGTSTVLGNTRLLIYSTSTESTRYAIRIFNKSEGPLFHVRNDGKVAIGTNTFGVTSTLTVAGEVQSASGGFRFPDNTVQTTAANGGSTMNAANVEAGQFGANTGGGNYTFPARVGIGTTAPASLLNIAETSVATPRGISNDQYSVDTVAALLSFRKSRNATIGSHGIVQSGDILGNLIYYGSDGTNFIQSAFVRAAVDGTPGTNDMPGRLEFATTADGSSGSTIRMTIKNNGNVGIGTTDPVIDGNTSTFLTLDGGASNFGEFSVGRNQGSAAAAVGLLNFFNSALGVADKRIAVIMGATDGATNSGNLRFYTGNAGTLGERVRIDLAGNVGIGTTAPSTKLHVAGNARITGLANCNTIDTDANGNLFCGTDDQGITGMGDLNYLARWTGAGVTLGSGATQDNGLRVGIGGAPHANLPLKVYGGMEVGGSVIPGCSVCFGYDIGLSSSRWRTVYAQYGDFAGDVTISGVLTASTISGATHQLGPVWFNNVGIAPAANGTYKNGTINYRWSELWANSINGADIGFHNGWLLREWPAAKEDVDKPLEWFRENANQGVQIIDDNGELQAVIHKNGNLYIRGEVKSLDELPGWK